ncbi:acyl-CoA dehydrogenase family protein [Geodermatophilus obscurus]|uniref:Acyl-CoA dehydrogenase domain protein n=1 Tax=Geodermatophilus obscurus (strain ATCC 25078 / DSM 43160 / JCM 3152 / CCUG 61914 / KCC A-0152 / KCTC 9177 / NBRC 13315 / NRRL B-3577 / G-20) TaxID=526225 RepID=D2SD35_GEOOG|nr:acyl-CoA dehydrogenase family protein [Geodermatophilus obscurus]ADB76384.1 acyl-CoA dehydrogenase domain protein [Geodermatophilus obscurus DSM 43160]
MSDQDLVIETVRDILSAHEPFALTADTAWDAGLWADLAEAGLTGVGLPEEAGGSGGELADAVAVVRTLAAGAGAVPVAEQLLAAGPALLAAGLDLPDPAEPLTLAVAGAVTAEPVDDGDGPGRWRLTGTATDVAWAGVARHVAVLAAAPEGIEGAVLALVGAEELATSDARNLAGEPRGSLVLGGAPAAGALLTPAQAGEVRARFALARAVQLAAALERVLAWTVQYAGERHQFGRPLGKFQAIQMELAEMAGEVTAVTALTDAAVQALGRGDDVVLAAAAAKVRAGAAVEVVARLAHQVHGAIGFTYEHKLHHLTRRLWSWRDEAGSELTWSQVLGVGLLAEGGDGLWPALTRVV